MADPSSVPATALTAVTAPCMITRTPQQSHDEKLLRYIPVLWMTQMSTSAEFWLWQSFREVPGVSGGALIAVFVIMLAMPS